MARNTGRQSRHNPRELQFGFSASSGNRHANRMNRMRRQRKWAGSIVGTFIIAFIVGISYSIAAFNHTRSVHALVQDKERVCGSHTDSVDKSTKVTCQYLIFTDKGTFENTDSLLRGKFNSSDVYGRIQKGQQYDFTVQGFRQPIFSMYPNIIEVH